MQRFNAPLTTEDGKVSRQVRRIVMMIYAVVALSLTAALITQLAFRDRSAATVEASAKDQAIGITPGC